MRTSVISILLALGVLAGANFIGQQGTTEPARPPEAQGQAAETPKETKEAKEAQTVAKQPKWPIAFADATAPATRVDASNELKLAPLVTNASPDAHEVIVKVALRLASGATADTTLTCETPQRVTEPVPGQVGGQPPASGAPPSDAQKTPATALPASSCKVTLPAEEAILPLSLTVRLKDAARDRYPLNGVVAIWPATSTTQWSERQPRAALPLSNIMLESAPAVDWAIVAGSARWALAAVLLGTLACAVLLGSPFQRMGDASFSFTDSWSGALMIGTPLLTAFLTTFTSFPDHTQTMSKKSYLLLSIMLAAIIGLAPALFNLWKLPTTVTNTDGTVSTQNQGLVLFFFVAAWVALTGGLGQLQLLRYIVVDLAAAAFLSGALRDSLVWTVDALFWLVLAVSIVSMVTTVAGSTAKRQPVPAKTDAGLGQRMQDAANAPPAAARARLATWSLP